MEQKKQTNAHGCGSCGPTGDSQETRINIFDEIAKMTDHLDGIGEEEVIKMVHDTFKES